MKKPEKKKIEWDPETIALAGWFLAGPALPAAPFALGPGRTVVDAGKFRATLEADVRSGPEGPRSATGALQEDLRAVKRISEGA